MEFQKIVEELLDENVALGGDDKKKGIIAANFTTKTGLYASAQTGTSAGVLAPQFQTASSGGSKSSGEQSNIGAEEDTSATRKSNYRKNSSRGCRGSTKNNSKGSKGTIIKYKPVDFGGKL
jgi:hypothetical protein